MSLVLAIEPFDVYRLDGLTVDTLLLPMFDVVAQPQGAAGQLDWRLIGRLAALIQSRRFKGARGEVMMLSYRARIAPARVILFGLGAPGPRDAGQHAADVQAMVAILNDAKAEEVALGPPEPEGAACVESWLGAKALGAIHAKSLLLLDAGGELAARREALTRAAKRRGLTLT